MQTNKRHILVTGAAGFIGFHLCLLLKKNKDYVIGCDNFNDYYELPLKYIRASKLKKEGIEVLETDINHLDSYHKFFVKKNITHVVHLAAQAGVRYSLTHPHVYVHSNLSGLTKALELTKKLKASFIFASSSSVYGGNKKTPFSETDITKDPLSFYAATKISGEAIAKSYHHLFNIPITILRFFTVYGPWGRPDMAYYLFAKNIMDQKPIPVFNHGVMQRDFTYVDDILDGIFKAINRCKGYSIFNLGNNKPEPLMNLIKCLENSLERKAVIRYKEMQPGDVLSTCADISKANKILGYSPKTTLEMGISHFAKWFKNYYKL